MVSMAAGRGIFSGHGKHGELNHNPPIAVAEKGKSDDFQMRFNGDRHNSITIPVNINPAVMPRITLGGWFNPSGIYEEVLIFSRPRRLGPDP